MIERILKLIIIVIGVIISVIFIVCLFLMFQSIAFKNGKNNNLNKVIVKSELDNPKWVIDQCKNPRNLVELQRCDKNLFYIDESDALSNYIVRTYKDYGGNVLVSDCDNSQKKSDCSGYREKCLLHDWNPCPNSIIKIEKIKYDKMELITVNTRYGDWKYCSPGCSINPILNINNSVEKKNKEGDWVKVYEWKNDNISMINYVNDKHNVIIWDQSLNVEKSVYAEDGIYRFVSNEKVVDIDYLSQDKEKYVKLIGKETVYFSNEFEIKN